MRESVEVPATRRTMVYRVVTRWKPLNVRVRPSLGYRVVHQLPRGAVVTVYETQRNDEGTWHRVEQGWCWARYLERVAVDEAPPPTDTPRLPDFLRFDPVREGRRRQRLRRLQQQREYAEERFVTYSQSAAQHGSRMYEMDEASRTAAEIQRVARLGDGAPTPGITALETGHEARLRREFEEEAAHWRDEMRRLDQEIDAARQPDGEDD